MRITNIKEFLHIPSQAELDFFDDVAYRPRANWKPPHTTMPVLSYTGTLPPRNNHNIMLAVGMLQANRLYGVKLYKPDIADEIIIYSLADTFRAIVKRKIQSLDSQFGGDIFDEATSEDAWDRALERVHEELHSEVKIFDPIKYCLCGEDEYLPEVYERVAAGENINDVLDELAVNGLLYDHLCEFAQRGVDKARNDKKSYEIHHQQFTPRVADHKKKKYYIAPEPSQNVSQYAESRTDSDSMELSEADYKVWRYRFRDLRHRDEYLAEWLLYCHSVIDELIWHMRLVQGKSYEDIARVVTRKYGKCGHDQVRRIWLRIVADHKAGVGAIHGWPDDLNIR
jgi:hypothetical protein